MSKLSDLLSNPSGRLCYAAVAEIYDPVSKRAALFPISTAGFTSLPTDGVPNYFFAPRIDSLPTFKRSLFAQGRLSGSSDSPETALVANATDGQIDYFYDFAWAARPVELLVGGEGFALREYGTIAILAAQEPTYTDDAITIPLRDVSFLADREIQSRRYATGDQLAGKVMPEVWGYCPKVQPIYLGVDTVTGRHRFGVGSGPIVGVTDVWDRGSPLLYANDPANPLPGEYIVDVATGTVTLGGSFVGPIQVSVIGRRYLSVTSTSTIEFGGGVKSFAVTPGPPEPQFSVGMKVRCLSADDPNGTWLDGFVVSPRPGGTLAVNMVAGQTTGATTISNWIICPWGTAAGILCAMADALGLGPYIEPASRIALNEKQAAVCGYWVPEGGNGRQLLDAVAEGTGCYWYIGRFNGFFVGRVDLPTGDPVATFDEMGIDKIERISTDEPVWQVVLRHMPSWSTLTQDQIAGVANPLAFTEKAWTMTGLVPENRTTYLSERSIEIELLFQDYNAALSELNRQFNMFGYRRNYFRITLSNALLRLNLTHVIKVSYPRYGLQAGKLFTVIDIEEDYNTGKVIVGAWG